MKITRPLRTAQLALLAALATLAVAVIPTSAAANDLYTLDPNAVSRGSVIQDAAGNAYVGWSSEGVGTGPEVPKFCKIAPGAGCAPVSLSIPGAASLSDSVSAVFPVFGPGSVVYAVGPRYARNDVIIWTSVDGGVTFDGGTEINHYSSKTNPTDVFLSGSTFMIGAYNAGLGFSTAEVAGLGGGSIDFANPGSGGVASSSMGLAGDGNPVIAYWNISDPPYPLLYYRYKGAGDINSQVNWEGPLAIGNGYEPELAGGPAGLFMASQDYAGGQYPSAITVRRYEGTSFGPARTLVNDASTDLFVGGAIAQSTGGRLAVAWPGSRASDGAYVMRLFSSTDGGGSFAESHVARIGEAYGLHNNADLAVNDNGAGWIVFTDRAGLRIADLSPIAPGPVPAAPLPPIYKGKTKLVVKKAGPFLITLRLPKSCLQSNQRFFIGVGKRKRRALSKKLGGKLHFTKIVFIYDGKKLKVKKKKPFRYLVQPGPMVPGSTHVVKARVTAVLDLGKKEKKIKRVLKGKVRAC
jgi:hypothetical protein